MPVVIGLSVLVLVAAYLIKIGKLPIEIAKKILIVLFSVALIISLFALLLIYRLLGTG